jgi:cysteinyl-tRNA synthetase
MRVYNYLTRKVEDFKPINEGQVGLYTCGPTVYDFVHIGNWRTFVFEDILKRALQFGGFEVTHVMNFTDIDDKIIKRAKEENVPFGEITRKYEEAFCEDIGKLNILPADFYTRATEYIPQMLVLIQRLLDRGIAYKADDGIYFSVEKFPNYGKLSGLSKGNLKKGARVNDDLYDKEAWSDFALWKYKKEGEPSWPAPFGEGRPGWHIECSAMSIDKLGEHFDIHCGGVDLLFPHHENEIAQAEAATGAKFVNVWMEGEHLLVNGEKMSKSLGNFFKLEDIAAKGFDSLALRYLFLTAHYRTKLNFTWESLESAQNALQNLRQEVAGWDGPNIGCSEFEGNFRKAISDDLNMPRAIAVMWKMVKSDYPTSAKHQSVLVMDKVLGLGLDKVEKAELPKDAQGMIDRREQLRKEGKFEESDKLRAELAAIGVEIEDTSQGTKWKIVKVRP